MSFPRSESDAGTSDAALIARLRGNDPAALDVLLRVYGAPLIRHAAHTVGSADRAQELVQDIFWQLWEERATLEVERDLGAYLFWLTRKRALDVLRSDRATMQREGRWASESAREPLENLGASAVEAAEVRAEIWDALKSVPPRCREIFMLVWDRQLSYAEVARTFGIGVPTVKNQMSRAVKRLVDILGPRFKGGAP